MVKSRGLLPCLIRFIMLPLLMVFKTSGDSAVYVTIDWLSASVSLLRSWVRSLLYRRLSLYWWLLQQADYRYISHIMLVLNALLKTVNGIKEERNEYSMKALKALYYINNHIPHTVSWDPRFVDEHYSLLQVSLKDHTMHIEACC